MADTAFGKALANTREVELTTTGRKTGRQISLPVWFVVRGDKLYLLPVRGSKSDWYQNLRKTPSIRLAAGPAEHTAPATPVTDPAQVETVGEAFPGKDGPHALEGPAARPGGPAPAQPSPGRFLRGVALQALLGVFGQQVADGQAAPPGLGA